MLVGLWPIRMTTRTIPNFVTSSSSRAVNWVVTDGKLFFPLTWTISTDHLASSFWARSHLLLDGRFLAQTQPRFLLHSGRLLGRLNANRAVDLVWRLCSYPGIWMKKAQKHVRTLLNWTWFHRWPWMQLFSVTENSKEKNATQLPVLSLLKEPVEWIPPRNRQICYRAKTKNTCVTDKVLWNQQHFFAICETKVLNGYMAVKRSEAYRRGCCVKA